MAKQAQNLHEFVRKNRQRARVLAVTSGKGGVGKTSVSANLAIALAGLNLRVVLLDADLGLANVEVLLGLNSLSNLQQVVQGERRMLDILVEGPGGIRIVPGSSGISRLADLGPVARKRILDGVDELHYYADCILIDTMAGIGQNAVAFAAAADEVLLVTTPEPSAIVDGYAMLKTIYQTRKDVMLRLIVNFAINEQQALAVAQKLKHVAHQYLGCDLSYLGYIPRDPHVSRAVMQTRPFLLRYPAAPASRRVEELARSLFDQRMPARTGLPGFLHRFAQNLGLASNA